MKTRSPSPSPLRNELISNNKLQKNKKAFHTLDSDKPISKKSSSHFTKNNLSTKNYSKQVDSDKMNSSNISNVTNVTNMTNTSVINKSSKNNSTKNLNLPLSKETSNKNIKPKLYHKSDSSESPEIKQRKIVEKPKDVVEKKTKPKVVMSFYNIKRLSLVLKVKLPKIKCYIT